MKIKGKRGQNLLEYALILGVVTIALVGMQTYFKRGVQSVIKAVADNYGTQGDQTKDVEIAIKKQIYAGKSISNSRSVSMMKKSIENKGNGAINTTSSGDNIISGSSSWVSGDFRERDVRPVSPGSY